MRRDALLCLVFLVGSAGLLQAQPLIPPAPVFPTIPLDSADLQQYLQLLRGLELQVSTHPDARHLPRYLVLERAFQTLISQEKLKRRADPADAERVWDEIRATRKTLRAALIAPIEDPFALENQRNPSPDEATLLEHGLKLDTESLRKMFDQRILSAEERTLVARWIKELNDADFNVRKDAQKNILARGPAVLDLLRPYMFGSDLEMSRKTQRCAELLQEADYVVTAIPALIRVLDQRGSENLIEALVAYLPYCNAETITEEVRAVLQTHALSKQKTPHPALVAALSDPLEIRRGVAGESLVRAGYLPESVTKLLKDPAPIVRFRVGMALAYAGQREALPVLIESLPQFAMPQAWQVEDLLHRLALSKDPPKVALGSEPDSRKQAAAAWKTWYDKHGQKIDLASLKEQPDQLGNTLVVLLDLGRVAELGPQKQTLWQVDGLNFPLDVQLLDNGNLLVAEYHGHVVTERYTKGPKRGMVIEEKSIYVTGPLAAQRLASGNTFVATDSGLYEFDPQGKELSKVTGPEGERIMKASKLPGGDFAILTSASRIYRLDPKGEIRTQFNVNLGMKLFGGRIHMLPNGRVLVPHNAEHKVVEYDATGKILWEANIEAPIAATRLPNGNTLVTSMLPQRGAVEFNRKGEKVWEYQSETRVTRAIRR